MSATATGKVILDADASRFNTAVGSANQSLQRFDQQTTKSAGNTRQLTNSAQQLQQPFSAVSTQATTAGQKIDTLGIKAQQTSGKINQVTQSSERARHAMQGMGQSANVASNNMQRINTSTTQATQATGRFNANSIGTAASIGTMGAGLVSLEASMSNYAKATYKVEKAELGVQKARDTLQKSQTMLLNAENMLEKARKSGTKTASEMQYYEEQAINYRQDVATKTEDLTLKQERLNIVNMDYADTQKLMASSIATTLLGTISAAAQMISAKSIATTKDTVATKGNTLSNMANSRVLKLLGVDLKAASMHFQTARMATKGYTLSATGAKVSLTGLSAATKAVSASVKGLYASIGPLGWAIIGITTIWQAWEENLFGFRDGIHWVIDGLQEVYGILKNFLPVLGLVEGAFSALGIELGKNVDEWQEADKAIYQTDETLQHVDSTMYEVSGTTSDLTQAASMLTTAEGELEIQTDEATTAIEGFDDAMGGATQATILHTTAISADMAMLRSHANALRENSDSMLSSHITSFDSAADAILTHDERLRVNLAGLQNWAKNYKEKMTESEENGAKFVTATESEFERLVSSLREDGYDVQGSLELMGITTIDTSQIIQDSMIGAGQSMHGFAADTESAGMRVQTTMKTIHNEIAAFEAALKKNDNFIEWTISDILRGFKAMTQQAQAEYEKIMILKAKSIVGGNTSIDSLEDALTITEQTRTGNWNNPTHAEGIGANMQHHGPGERSNKANELLKEGYYVVDPVGDGVWRKSHSDSYKLGKKHHSKTGKPRGVALWNGRDFVIYKPGSDEYVERFGISGFTTKYTTGGPSSRSVALETSLGYDINKIQEQIDGKSETTETTETDETPQAETDQRQILEVHAK